MKKLIFVAVTLLVFTCGVMAQGSRKPRKIILPNGASAQLSDDGTLAWNANGLYAPTAYSTQTNIPTAWGEVQTQEIDEPIVCVGKKTKTSNAKARPLGNYLLTSGGEVYRVEKIPGTMPPKYTFTYTWFIEPSTNYSDPFHGFLGDNLYAYSYYMIWVQRDSGGTFTADTMGLHGVYLWNMAMDTAQTMFVATERGLYTQGHTDSVWTRVPGLSDTNSISTVFIDVLNRIFVSTYNFGTWISTDDGSTWSPDTAGLGKTPLSEFTADTVGNVYGVNNGLYMSAGGTGTWIRIDTAVASLIGSAPRYNSIAALPGGLLVATQIGLLTTTDQGVTWVIANNGFSGASANGFVKTASGRFVLTTNLGLYYQDPSDTAWTQSLPAHGFAQYGALYQDSAGNLFTFGTGFGNGNNTIPLMKSTDGGTTWNFDTLGISSVQGENFYIDEHGTQHMGPSGSTTAGELYYRPLGGAWTIDSAGFTTNPRSSSFSSCFASDYHGKLYVSGIFSGQTNIARRPINGGTWSGDTTGLKKIYVTYFPRMTAGKDGHMIGMTSGGINRDTGSGNWYEMALPDSDLYAVLYCISVDSSGALFLSISGYPDDGIFYTRDYGATWTAATGGTSLHANQMISYGDTTYAVTDSGIFAFSSVAPPAPTVYSLANSWNLVSVPQVTANPLVTVLFPTAQSHAFGYLNGYVQKDSLSPGSAYWLKFGGAQQDSVAGTEILTDTLPMALGWNLFGATAAAVPVSSIELIPGGTWVTSHFFGYKNGYFAADTLMPGQGYWVKTDTAGSFGFTGGGSVAVKKQSVAAELKSMDELTITDAKGHKQKLYVSRNGMKSGEGFEMPPPPPAGSFDARFGDGMMAEAIANNASTPISISGAAYPLSVNWKSAAPARQLQIVVDGKVSTVEPGSSLKIGKAFKKLAISLGGSSALPTEFRLEQNYPNPFNPTTTIQYALPVDSRVTLKIYNILGQVVSTLVNESENAGYTSAAWNASSFASGMYFYRIDATSIADPTKKFTETKKLMVLK